MIGQHILLESIHAKTAPTQEVRRFEFKDDRDQRLDIEHRDRLSVERSGRSGGLCGEESSTGFFFLARGGETGSLLALSVVTKFGKALGLLASSLLPFFKG